jgi:drug/metabolite transporter (DMT)-like permease
VVGETTRPDLACKMHHRSLELVMEADFNAGMTHLTLDASHAAPPSVAQPAPTTAADLRGIAAMLVSMAAFVVNDTCVKLASVSLPIGEIITLRNGTAAVCVLALAVLVGGLTLPRTPPVHLLTYRVIGEIASTMLFLVALVSLPLADMTAIAQFTPLALTAGAAIFLAEPVGWRRWMATLVGLVGVGFIVRPGSTAFSVPGLMVAVSIGFVVLRDLATRQISTAVPTVMLTLMSALAGMVAGLLLWPFEVWQLPTARETGLVAMAGLFLAFGYGFIIVALRTGDVGVVSPFRYAVILFALASSYLVWGHLPDGYAIFGIAIVCSAGLYTVHRETIRRRTRRPTCDGHAPTAATRPHVCPSIPPRMV